MTHNNCHRHEWGNLEFGNCHKYCHQQTLWTLSSTIVRNVNEAICWLDICYLLWTLSSTMSSAIFINNCHEHEWGNLLVGHLARAGSDWCPVPHTEMASAVAFKMVGWKKGMNIKMRWWSTLVDDRYELVINIFIVSSPPDEGALSLKACGNILFKFQMQLKGQKVQSKIYWYT